MQKKTSLLKQTSYIFFIIFIILFCFVKLHFWESSLYSRFLIFAFWYLLSILYLKNPILSVHFYLGVWLLAWLLSPPFDSPFSPPGHLYLLPPPSLLYPTMWISLCVLDGGEQLGNWLLAGSVSLLLTPPLLLLVTSISFLPLLFSMLLCEPLWVSLTVENLFTINLDVLSLVLYGWRSLETTVRIRLKARGRRLKSKTWEHQKTPDSREH